MESRGTVHLLAEDAPCFRDVTIAFQAPLLLQVSRSLWVAQKECSNSIFSTSARTAGVRHVVY